ncbi:phage polarity suppression protein [Atlantibacter sp.]|uniref:phage polarity suppression protein n=1 Tax=Atlantibacter sp. TaxID=1903473 RepID=UPI0028966516|nr:phage polarity suppression protein [Atlantibacter sp.]
MVRHRAFDCVAGYFRETLNSWQSEEKEVNYFEQENDIIISAGHRPDAASKADNQEKYTPAQHQVYARRCAEMNAQRPA